MDFKEAQESGELIVYTDTDPEVEREVKEYNEMMSDCRKKKKRVNELHGAFLILNPLIVVGLSILDSYTTNTIQGGNLGPDLARIIFAAVFIYFVILKNNLVIPTAVSVLLIPLHIGFAMLTAADVILAVWHTKLLSRLKKIEGYPHFTDITIKYSRDPENGYRI